MIEITGGGPLDGNLTGDFGPELRVAVRASRTAPVTAPAMISPTVAAPRLYHCYALRRRVEETVYEYIGEVWR